MLHFVGFSDDRFWAARRIFGPPDFIHRFWDHRAVGDIAPGDTVVFAEGDEAMPCARYSYDDSAHF